MSVQDIIASIDMTLPRFEKLGDDALRAWAVEAVGVFNAPPAGPQERMVELIGRELTRRLQIRVGDCLPPSIYRITQALCAVLSEESEDTKRRLGMWAEVIGHYLSESAGRPSVPQQRAAVGAR